MTCTPLGLRVTERRSIVLRSIARLKRLRRRVGEQFIFGRGIICAIRFISRARSGSTSIKVRRSLRRIGRRKGRAGMIWRSRISRGWGAGPKAEDPGVANKAIALKNCRNVLLRDFSILHGGHFGILATGVDNLTIDNLRIDTNRDGMDIDCCRNVRVSNCSVNSPWDDAICLKSSFALGYARATEMVTISNCLVSGSYEEGALLDATFKRFASDFKVPRTGRIKFGTESNGGFQNITISNCVFEGCRGLAIESVDGAVIEDVSVTNITMRDVVEAPIFLRLAARMRGPKDATVGVLRRVILSNLSCACSGGARIGSIVAGIPGH